MGLGHRRAFLRTLYSYALGSYMSRNPQNSGGDPSYIFGGAIYYLAPSLIGAANKLRFEGLELESASVKDLIKMTHQIVLQSSLDPRAFAAIAAFLQAPQGQGIVDRYQDMAYNNFELFSKAYQTLLHFSVFGARVKRAAFDEGRPEQPSATLKAMNLRYLCELATQGPKERILHELDTYRKDLHETPAEASQQRLRARELNHLFQSLSETCGPHLTI